MHIQDVFNTIHERIKALVSRITLPAVRLGFSDRAKDAALRFIQWARSLDRISRIFYLALPVVVAVGLTVEIIIFGPQLVRLVNEVTGLWRSATVKKIDYSFHKAPEATGFALLNQNKAGGFTILLGKRDTPAIPQARFEVGKSSIEFSLVQHHSDGAGYTTTKVALAKEQKEQVKWTNVLFDTDIAYQVQPDGLKEDIIFTTPSIAQQAINDRERLIIFFDVTTLGVFPKKTFDNRGVIFADSLTGGYRFHLEQPYLVDANGTRYDGLAYSLVPVENPIGTTELEKKIARIINPVYAAQPQPKQTIPGRKYRLILTLPREWLTDPKRVYPVTLDPTVTHNTQTAFATGYMNRVKDEGTADASPLLTSKYHELAADINTQALYHFSNGACATDSSGNSYTLTANGGMTCSTGGQFGYKASGFATTPVSYSNATVLDVALPSGTIEAWINPANLSAVQTVIYADSTSDTLVTVGTSGQVNLQTSASTNLATANSLVAISTWTHIAAVWTSTGHKIYVNGIEQANDTNTTTHTSQDYTTYIGVGSGGNTLPFSGSIEEIRISKVARTPEEIKQDATRFPYSVYTSPVMDLGQVLSWTNLTWLGKGIRTAATGDGETPISTTGLVAQWNFNETSGTSAVSAGSCGTSCNMTLNNFASTASQDQAAGTGWTANNKKWGAGALMISSVATADSLSLADPASNVLDPNSADMAIETWIKTTDVSAEIFSNNNANGTACTNNGYYLGIDASGYPVFYLDTNGATAGCDAQISTGITTKINDGAWHHLAVSVTRGTSALMYLDGVQIGSDTSVTSYASITVTGTVYMGGSAGGLDATLDSTRIYSRALTAAEILANYQAGQIEFQTRSSADNSTWEAWKPVTNETAVDSMDSAALTAVTNCKGLYHFENNGNADASCGSNLTTTGTLTYGTSNPSPRAGSYDVGGFTTGNYYTLPNAALPVATSGTIEMFWAPGSLAANQYLWYATDGTNASYMYVDTSGVIHAKIGSGTEITSTAGINQFPTLARWYHLALTFDATNWILYKDGAQINSTARAQTLAATTTAYIGINTGPASPLTGNLDEFRTVTVSSGTAGALSAATIAQDSYWQNQDKGSHAGVPLSQNTDTTTKIEGTASEKLSIGSPQVDSSTVGAWHLDETSTGATDIKDATANANNSTTVSGTTSVDGFFGKAKSFNGSSDYIEANDANSLDLSTNGTIEAWIKTSTNKANNWFLCKNGNYCLGVNATGAFLFTGASAQDNAGTSLLAGQWHHIAITNNNTTVTYYIDGVSAGTDTVGWGTTLTNTLRIGRDGGTNYFSGAIDEVRISNVVRTADEIAEAYRAGRDHRITKTLSTSDLSARTKLPFYVAADRPGTYLSATIGESNFANYEPDTNTAGFWHLEEQTGHVSVIKSVQSGTTTLASGNSSVTATITSVDTTKSFLVYSLSLNDSAAINSQVSGEITNATTLTFYRYTTAAVNITIKWYVAEFVSGVTVQRGTATTSSSPFNVTINSVNTAKSFPIINGYTRDGQTYGADDFEKAKITSATNLELTQVSSSLNSTLRWQVVEYTDATVQTGDVSFITTDSSKTATVNSVDPAKSWLLYTYTTDSNAANISNIFIQGTITNSTTLTFNKDGTGNNNNLTWYLVTFNDETTVQSGSQNFATGDTQKNVTITSVDTARSIAAAGSWYHRGGKSGLTTDDNVGMGSVTLDLTSATNLQLTRGTSGSTADIGWFVVQFDNKGYVKDSSSNSNSGAPSGTTYIQGKIGKARSFNGSSDFVSITDAASLRPTSVTVDTWIKTSTAGTQALVDKSRGSGVGSSYYLGIGGLSAACSNTAAVNFTAGTGAAWVQLCGVASVNDGNWHHVAATYDGTAANIYLDGKLDATGTLSQALNYVASANLFFGKYNSAGNSFFNGTLDEVRVSSSVRTADEIRQAYEIGKKTHPITIDFVTSPQAAYSLGTSVTINNPSGTTNLTDTLAVGDTMIFKENVAGTETVGQAVVSAIANTSTTYGTVTLASAPTFPSGGYTTNAKVFKWQREYFDITGSLSTHRDAITRLTMRVTDGSQGANVWLDDLRSNTNYINLNTPTSFDTAAGIGTYSSTAITSTLNRYFQYRAILSSSDTPVSPQLTSVAWNYTAQLPPNAPTISAPTDGATNVSISPVVTLSSTDTNSDYIQYKLQIATDTGFTQNLQTFDQSVSQTGWSGQNATITTTNDAYTSGSTATYTFQTQLTVNTVYYIRAYGIDPGGTNTWGSASSTVSFSHTLAAPTGCQVDVDNNTTNSVRVTWANSETLQDNYYVESSVDGGAWSALATLSGNALFYIYPLPGNGTYQYRVRLSSGGTYTGYCTTDTITLPFTNVQFEKVQLEKLKIR